MKAVRRHIPSHLTKSELLEAARASEVARDFTEAASFYQKVIKIDPHNETAYSRLMIIHRKLKESEEELEVVKKAIDAFEEMYASSTKKSGSRKVSNLSNAFLQATGLANKKGEALYQPEPVAKWAKRKALLEKKLKKS